MIAAWARNAGRTGLPLNAAGTGRHPHEQSTGERILAGQRVKLRGRYDQMDEAAHSAHRAIATLGDDVRRRFDFEGHRAAMTAASVANQRIHVGLTASARVSWARLREVLIMSP